MIRFCRAHGFAPESAPRISGRRRLRRPQRRAVAARHRLRGGGSAGRSHPWHRRRRQDGASRCIHAPRPAPALYRVAAPRLPGRRAHRARLGTRGRIDPGRAGEDARRLDGADARPRQTGRARARQLRGLPLGGHMDSTVFRTRVARQRPASPRGASSGGFGLEHRARMGGALLQHRAAAVERAGSW